jgi:hypothetical protein
VEVEELNLQVELAMEVSLDIVDHKVLEAKEELEAQLSLRGEVAVDILEEPPVDLTVRRWMGMEEEAAVAVLLSRIQLLQLR